MACVRKVAGRRLEACELCRVKCLCEQLCVGKMYICTKNRVF